VKVGGRSRRVQRWLVRKSYTPSSAVAIRSGGRYLVVGLHALLVADPGGQPKQGGS
jgi:hypothetical protein